MIDCSKCPEGSGCCGIIPFKKEFWEKHKEKMQVEVVIKKGTKEFVVVAGKDIFCVFMNRETKLCAVYDDRPEVCRLYGTKEGIEKSNYGLACQHFRPNGKEWSKAAKAKILHIQRKNLKKMLRKSEK